MLQTAIYDNVVIHTPQYGHDFVHNFLAVPLCISNGIVLGQLHDLKSCGRIGKSAIGRNQVNARLGMQHYSPNMKLQILRVVDSCQKEICQCMLLFSWRIAKRKI